MVANAAGTHAKASTLEPATSMLCQECRTSTKPDSVVVSQE